MALKARVENGHLKLDEPTNLPDGTEVELVIRDGDLLSDEERLRLHSSLDRAFDDEDSGRFVDTQAFLAEVRAGT
ncbi:MAG: hypothetical protein B6A08_00215 [Sorangiineae bacterium NIC37A_2]|jgi:predicted DNA-binding antitoxin AbrB/MazE fold protein|nr:MAG: hypothetical protein B6A08_00215 [Sorangiineae bacterium NIC37A_2]